MIEKSWNGLIEMLFKTSENTFHDDWHKQVMEDAWGKQWPGKLSLKRISINFNLAERQAEIMVEKIAIELPHINIFHEIYLDGKLIGHYSYFVDLEFNFLDEFIYYNL